MRASGIGVWSFVAVVSLVSVAGWGIGLANTLYFAPKATATTIGLESELLNAQASYEVQPRVFYEDFKNYVLYVQDVVAASGAANWRQVFLADLSDPAAPKITTGAFATVVNGKNKNENAIMRLRDGTEHQTVTNTPDQYNVSTFAETDLPLMLTTQEDTHASRNESPILAMSNSELLERSRATGGRWYLIELHKRFAYPTACLVLMLVGVPLGISSRRGGKGAGFVLTIVLVFVYYFLSSTGTAMARQNKAPVAVGIWLANVLFAACGVFFLRQMSTGGAALAAIASIGGWLKSKPKEEDETSGTQIVYPSLKPRHTRGRFPLILDEYVLAEFLTAFGLVLVSLVMLMLIFTFFELLGDMMRNRTPVITVLDYLANLTPNMIYMLTPLAVLVAVLVVFGLMTKSSELTAMKASGISLYRIILPIFIIAAILASALFIFDQLYLPKANRRQEALRSLIKGKPSRTFEHPGQNWIFGLQDQGKPGRIFYYELFDPAQNSFGNLTIFEFDPETFSISRRIFASNVHWEPQLRKWVFEHGWERTFKGDEISNYRPFDVSTFSEIREQPQYFKKEALLSSEMSFSELTDYIHDLSQSGFDTIRLRVQLNTKIAKPVITLVIAILAVPFALSMGKRGSLVGIAVAIGVTIVYFIVSGAFEAMGNVNLLPALLAAWAPDVIFGLVGGYLLLRTST
jgi:LPS export ABC transporter permease LptG